jgi:hypothetical protein
VDACQLTNEEAEKINQEIQKEYQAEYLYILVESMIEIVLHLGEDMDAYENMISYFERVIQALLDQGEVVKAVDILKKLRETLESMVLKDKQIFAIRRILESAANPQSVKLLGKVMRGNGEVDSESVIQYLQFMTDKAVTSLCLLLGEVESGRWRKVVCDLLIQLSKNDIQPLVKFLSDRNPVVVLHILYILGKVGHPSTVRYLGNLSKHEDTKVDDFYRLLREASTTERRIEVWRQLQEYLFVEQTYVIPIAEAIYVVPYRTYVKGLPVPAEDAHTHTDFATVWLDKSMI